MDQFRYASLILWFAGFFLLRSDAAKMCGQTVTDYIFMIDGSRSVRPSNFVFMIDHMKRFVDIIDDLGPDKVQLGVVQFSSLTEEEIRLDAYTDKNRLKAAIDDIVYMQMGTMTGEALQFVVTQVLQPDHGSRLHQGVRTVLIVLTDGKSQDYTRGTLTKYQRIAKERGVEIFAIGIGRHANKPELVELASAPEETHVYLVERFEDIEKIDIVVSNQTICDEDECTLGTHNCSQICTNTESSYECSCRVGYELQEDLTSCARIVPDLTNSLWITNITHTSALANWYTGDDIGGDVFYLLGYQSTNGSGENEVIRVEGSFSTLLADLHPSTTYRVELSVVRSGVFLLPIEKNFTTLALGQTTVTLSNATLTTITATWSPAGGDLLIGYEVMYQIVSDDSSGEITNPAISRQFGSNIHRTVLSDLASDTRYSVRVIPRHVGGLVGVSSSAQTKTLRLTAPYIVITSTSLSTMAVRWKIKYNYRIRDWTFIIYPRSDSEDKRIINYAPDVYSAFIRQLRPNTFYVVEIFARIEDGERQINSPKGVASKRTRLIKKPNISITGVSASTLSFNWRELNKVADSWSVKIYPKGNQKLAKQRTTTRGQRSASFDGLWPATLYRIEVVGHVTEDSQSFSSPKGNQKQKTRPLAAPNVQILNPAFSSLTVSWNAINEAVDLWMVSIYRRGDKNPLQTYELGGDEREQMIGRLKANTQYRVTVRGRIRRDGRDFDSPAGSASGTTGTLTAPDVQIRNPTFSSLTASWNPINEAVDFWIVRIYRQGLDDQAVQEHAVDGNQTEYVFRSLQSNSAYRVAVFGRLRRNGYDYESTEGSASGSTGTLTAPTVRIQNPTFASLTASWNAINEAVDIWIVRVYLRDGGEVIKEYEVDGNLFGQMLDGLQSNTRYRVVVFGQLTRNSILHTSPEGSTFDTTGSLTAPTVQIRDPSFSSLTATWNSINEPVDLWIVRVFLQNVEVQNHEVSGDNFRRTIRELQPNTRYRIVVHGRLTRQGISYESPSGSDTGTTGTLTAPIVRTQNETFSSFVTTWNTINEPVDAWIVRLYRRGGSRVIQEKEIEPNQYKVLFGQLESISSYRVVVFGRLVRDEVKYDSLSGNASANTGVLEAPMVQITSRNFSSLTANWKAINVPVDEWRIFLYRLPENALGLFAEVDSSQLRNVFYGLLPNTDYRIAVQGRINKQGKIYDSLEGFATGTTAQLTAPIVSTSNLTPTSITAGWNSLNYDVDSWTVRISGEYIPKTAGAVAIPYSRTINVDGNHRNANFDNLTPSTNYLLEVTGNIGSLRSETGQTKATTRSLTAPPVEMTSTSLDSISISWGRINVNGNAWRVTAFDSDGDVAWRKTLPGGYEATVDGLESGETYRIQVVGLVTTQNIEHESPAGEVVASTKQLARNLVEIFGVTPTSMEVRWRNLHYRGEPSGRVVVDSWNITIRRADDQENVLQEIVFRDDTVCSTVFLNLTPDTEYVVEVAGNVRGIVNTARSFATTKQFTPNIVETYDVTPFSMAVRWRGLRYKDEPFSRVEVDSWKINIRRENSRPNDYIQEIVFRDDTVCSTVFFKLTPDTKYVVEVIGNVSGVVNTARNDASTESLSAPVVEISETTYSTLTVGWTDINVNVTHWGVQLLDDEENVIEVKNVNSELKEARFDELEQGASYQVLVIGVVETQEAFYESPAGEDNAQTSSLVSVMGPVIDCLESEVTSLNIVWSEVSSPVTSWNVSVYHGRRFIKKFTQSATELTAKISDLLPQTRYSIRVVGNIQEEDVTFRTQAGIVDCTTDNIDSPNVVFTNVSPLSIEIAWNKVNIDVDSWRVSLAKTGAGGVGATNPDGSEELGSGLQSTFEVERVVSGNEFRYTFHDLIPDTEYRAEVVGIVSGLRSRPGQNTTVTAPLSAPTVGVFQTSYTSFGFRWSDINVDVESWKIVILRQNGSSFNVYKSYEVPGSEREKVIEDLDQSTRYQARVSGILISGVALLESPSGETETRTDNLEAPGVSADEISPTSLGIRWTHDNKNINTWTVSIRSAFEDRPQGSILYYQETSVDGNRYDHTFDDLLPNTAYNIKVVGHLGEVNSEPGVNNNVVTSGLLAPVVQISDIGFASFYVNWSSINAPVGNWRLILRNADDAIAKRLIVPGMERSFDVEELNQGTSYKVQVIGLLTTQGVLHETPAGEASDTTKELSSPIVSAIEITPFTARVRWSSVNYNVDEWLMSQRLSDQNRLVENYTGDVLNDRDITLRDLEPDSRYTIGVVGQIGDVRSLPGMISFDTAAITAPTVEIVEITYSTITVRWTDINVDVTSWNITVQAEDEADATQTYLLSGSENLLTIRRLNENTQYTVRVKGIIFSSVAQVDYESPVGEISARTKSLSSVPGPTIDCTQTDATFLVVEWSDVTADVTTWNISVIQSKKQTEVEAFSRERNNRTAVINNLLPQTGYTIQVKGVFAGENLEFATQASTIICGTGALEGPSVTFVPSQTSFSSLTARWSTINAPVDSWSVILLNEDSEVVTEETVGGNVHQKVFSDLNPGASYTVNVQGIVEGEDEEIKSSSGQSVAITDFLLAPVLSCAEGEAGSIALEWYKADTDVAIDRWLFEMRSFPNGNATSTWEVGQNENQYNIANLNPATSYFVSVRGQITTASRTYTTDKEEVYCSSADLSTPLVRAAGITPISFRARWEDLNYPVDSWLVSLKKVVDSGIVSYPETEDEIVLVEESTVSASDRSKTFTNLDPNTEYLVEVTANVGDIQSNTGTQRAVTGSLNAPVVQLYDATTSSLQVIWRKINAPVDYWRVRLIGEPSEDSFTEHPEQSQKVDGNVLNATFSGLPPDSYHRIRVVGVLRDQESWPGTTTGFTAQLEGPLVEVVHTTIDTLEARWSGVNAEVHHYIAEVIDDEAGTPLKYVLNGTTHRYVFEELAPQTRYRVKITGVVLASNNESFQTPPGFGSSSTKPIIAPIVSVDRATTTTVGAMWGVINSGVDGWRVSIRRAPDSPGDPPSPPIQEVDLKNSVYSKVFVDLPSNTPYVVEVKGIVGKYESLPGTAEASTEAAMAPRVRISQETANSFVVNWNLINLPIDDWTIIVTPVSSTAEPIPPFPPITADADDRSAQINFLQPGTQYEVTVHGNWNGFRSPKGKATAQTEFLTAPEVEIVNVTYSTLTARWGDLNTEATGWTIFLKTEEGGIRGESDVRGNVHEKEFGSLEEGKTYVVEVFGYAEIGDEVLESPTGEASATTQSLITVAGPTVECSQTDVTSLTVEWSDVSSNVTFWNVTIYKEKQFIKRMRSEREMRRMQIEDLLPNTLYSIRVTGNIEETTFLLSTQPGTVNCTTDSMTAPAVSIDPTSVSFSSLTARWENINVPAKYWLVAILMNGSSAYDEQRVDGGTNFKEFTLLEPETDYTVFVRPVVSTDEEDIEGPQGQGVATTSELAAPIMRCGETDFDTAVLEWYDADSNVPMDAWQFEVYPFENTSQKITWEVSRENSTHQYTINGLTPDTNYIVTIRGRITVNNKMFWTMKEEVFCTTKRLPTPFTFITAVTPVSLRVNWNDVEYPVDNWIVSLLTSDTDGEASAYPDVEEFQPSLVQSVILSGEEIDHVFEKLTPQTQYFVRVVGLIGKFRSRPGSATATTGFLDFTDGAFVNSTATSVEVSWNDVNAPVDFWFGSIRRVEEENEDIIIIQNFTVPGRDELIGEEYRKVITNLTPDSFYEVRMEGFLRGKTTSPTFIHGFTERLITPQVQIVDSTLTSLTVRWSEINANVACWEATVESEETSGVITRVNKCSGPRELTFEDLDPSSRYRVNVVGSVVGSDGNSVKSPIGIALGTTDAVPPTVVEVHENGPTSLEVTWQPLDVEIDGWVVRIKKDPESDFEEDNLEEKFDQEIVVGADTYEKTIDGLVPRTPYFASVSAKKGAFEGLPSTGQDTTASVTSPEVSVTNSSITSLTVGWTPINIDTSFWMVQVYNVEEQNSPLIQNATVSSDNFEATIEDLSPGTRYKVTVSGVLELNNGETIKSPPGEIEGETLPVNSPLIETERIGPTQIRASWKPINIPVDFWIVRLSLVSNPETDAELIILKEEHELDRDVQAFNFTNLLPGAVYQVEVIGKTYSISSPPGQLRGKTEQMTAPVVTSMLFSPTTFYALWEEINVPVDTWNITLKQGRDDTGEAVVFKKVQNQRSDTAVIFDGVVPGSTYQVEVVGIVQDSVTSPTGVLDVTVDVLTSPLVEITDATATSMTVEWGTINEDVSSWAIELTNFDDGVKNFTVAGTDRDIIFEDLKPDTSYNVSIAGVVEVADGTVKSPNGVTEGTTRALNSPQVEIADTTPTSLRARWSSTNKMDSWVVSIFKRGRDTVNGYEEETAPFKEVVLEYDNMSVEFDGLYPDTRYTVKVVGKIQDNSSPPGFASDTTKSLNRPIVRVIEASVTALTVEWEAINEDASSWLIEVTSADIGEIKNFTLPGTTHNITFEDLTPDTSYDFSISALVQLNGMSAAQSLPGVTEGRTKPLAAPQVATVDLAPTFAVVEWTKINVPVDGWLVTLERSTSGVGSEEPSDFGQEFELDSSVLRLKLDDLYPGGRYFVRVVGKLGLHTSPDGFTTIATPPLTKPNVEVINSTLSTLLVRWNNINADVTGYNLEIFNNKTGMIRRYTHEEADLMFVFDDLKPGTRYGVKVRGVVIAENGVEFSPPGIAYGTTTFLYGPHVDCVETTANSVTVEWTYDETSHVVAWSLKIYPEGNEELTKETMLEMNVRSYTFSQMEPAATYIVEVQGTVADGDEEFSTPSMKDSCTTRPIPPLNFTITERGQNYLVASFIPLANHVAYEAVCLSPEGEETPAIITDYYAVKCLDLDYVTKYLIEIRAIYKNLSSEPNFVDATTTEPPPLELTLRNITTDSITVGWITPDIDGLDEFEVSYSSETEEFVKIVNGFQNSVVLDGLTPSTEYAIAVAGKKNQVPIVHSKDKIGKTLIDLQIDDVSYTSINVSWSLSRIPNVHSYALTYTPNDNSSMQDESLMLPPDVNRYFLNDLLTATKYNVSIRANYNDSSSSQQTQRMATTLALPPIGPLEFTDVTDSSFVVHWTTPENQPPSTSYTVTYSTMDSPPVSVELVIDTYLLVDELTPLTTFNVSVTAVYNNLQSDPIKGTVTTSDAETTCSCSSYLRAQAQMQSLLVQMMNKIDDLTEQVEILSRSRSTRSLKKNANLSKGRYH